MARVAWLTDGGAVGLFARRQGLSGTACRELVRTADLGFVDKLHASRISVHDDAMGTAQIRVLISRQDGLVTRAQARAAGLSDRQIAGLLNRRELVRTLPTVFRDPSVALTPRARIRAAWLWGGERSVIGGASAAFLWRQISEPPTAVTLVIDPSRRLRSRKGLIVVRRKVLLHDVLNVEGIRVLDESSAMVDLLLEQGLGATAALDRQLQRRRMTLHELQRSVDRLKGQRGTRGALLALAGATDGAEAESERRCVALLRAHGLTGWVCNATVRVSGERQVRPDFAFLAEKVAIEIDGWAWHSDPERFKSDRERQNALLLDGWLVLRFTWHDIVHEPERVVREVRAALASRRV